MITITKICLALSLVIWPAYASTSGGGTVDNGGEYLALKFTRMGFEAVSAMMKLSPNEAILDLQSLKRLEMALVHTRVDAVPGPLLDNSGRQVDARFLENDGKPLIEIDETRWPNFLEDRDTSHRLVVHEYLRVIRLNDDNYRISARLEQGTAREILHGKVVINPGSIGGQSKFEQLGDYFKNALQPSEADLGAKFLRLGTCITARGDLLNNQLKMYAHEINLGPALPASYRLVFDHRGPEGFNFWLETNQASFFSGSIYMKKVAGGQEMPLADTYLLRVKDSLVFLEAHLEAGRGKESLPGQTAKVRCYFW